MVVGCNSLKAFVANSYMNIELQPPYPPPA